MVCEGKIFPLEVKSGTGGSLRSLHIMLEKYPNCPWGLVLYSGTYNNLRKKNRIPATLQCCLHLRQTMGRFMLVTAFLP